MEFGEGASRKIEKWSRRCPKIQRSGHEYIQEDGGSRLYSLDEVHFQEGAMLRPEWNLGLGADCSRVKNGEVMHHHARMFREHITSIGKRLVHCVCIGSRSRISNQEQSGGPSRI